MQNDEQLDGQTIMTLDLFLEQVMQLAPNTSRQILEIAKRNAIVAVKNSGHTSRRLGRHLTPEQKQAVYKDGLTSMSNTEIVKKHKISRATLYRAMKG